MDLSVIICEKCREEISFNRTNYQCVLGEHLVTKHPNQSVVYFSCVNQSSENESESHKTSNSSKRTEPISSFNEYDTIKNEKDVKSCGIYKATVETWDIGPVSILCSACGYYGTPCIRKQRNKVAYTSVGALFLMGCWPLCFLPFLTSASKIHLFCKKCCYYLGEYNRKTGEFIYSHEQQSNHSNNKNKK